LNGSVRCAAVNSCIS